MTEPNSGRAVSQIENDEISFVAVGIALLRARRLIMILTILGASLGLLSAVIASRTYVSVGTFIPQSSEGTQSGLALEANRFGIRMPSSVGGWGVPIYVELLRSREVLERIAVDTVAVLEDGGRRVAVMDLLGVKADSKAKRIELAVGELRGLISANEVKSLGAVRLSVETRWASVSQWLADRSIERVHEYYLTSRNSQASEERRFVERQAVEAERILRESEDRLQAFLLLNRSISSPELMLQRDRLSRIVSLRQATLTTLLQNREEARIREVRDTPVITILQSPKLASVAEPRNGFLKTLFGAMIGVLLGAVIAYVSAGIDNARRAATAETTQFFALVSDATPAFIRKRLR